MKDFLIKCFVITACLICVIKSIPVQKYEFLDNRTRVNKCTGMLEHRREYGSIWE